MAAHTRLWRVRGSAREHPCAFCGGKAQQWAFMHDSSQTIVGPVTSGGKTFTCEWSPDPQDYQPLCGRCHVFFDREHANRIRQAALSAE